MSYLAASNAIAMNVGYAVLAFSVLLVLKHTAIAIFCACRAVFRIAAAPTKEPND